MLIFSATTTMYPTTTVALGWLIYLVQYYVINHLSPLMHVSEFDKWVPLGDTKINVWFMSNTALDQNWADYLQSAIYQCTKLGGRVYEPRSKDAIAIVTTIAQELGISTFWIGAIDKIEEGT